MRRAERTTCVLLATICLASAAEVSAHRLDEFLQAARIAIEPDHIELELDLTPGIAVADAVVGDIDADGNGRMSPVERQAYAEQVLRGLAVRVDDGPPLDLTIVDARFPDVAALGAGDGAIALRSHTALPPLTPGLHRVLFRNDHAADGSVYLANALVPDDDRVVVTGQERRFDQRELTIRFAVRAAHGSSREWGWFGLAGALLLAAGPGVIRRLDRRRRRF